MTPCTPLAITSEGRRWQSSRSSFSPFQLPKGALCRRLIVSTSKFHELTFVGSSLQSLECSLETGSKRALRQAVQKIGAFTALTRLALSQFKPAGADFAAVHKLPLQELELLHCQNLEVELIVPGALLLLRSLHIEDSVYRKRRVSKQPEMMEKLAVCSRSLLSLPHLYQLTGTGALFTFAMKDVLKTWHVAKYQRASMGHYLHSPAKTARLMVWSKP